MGTKHTVLPNDNSPMCTFTVLEQLCGPELKRNGDVPALFSKMGKEGLKLENKKIINATVVVIASVTSWQSACRVCFRSGLESNIGFHQKL